MSARLVLAVLEDPLDDVPARRTAAKLVLVALAECANDRDPVAWISLETIARRTSMSVRNARRALGLLEDAGRIQAVDGRRSAGGRGLTTHWRPLPKPGPSGPGFGAEEPGPSGPGLAEKPGPNPPRNPDQTGPKPGPGGPGNHRNQEQNPARTSEAAAVGASRPSGSADGRPGDPAGGFWDRKDAAGRPDTSWREAPRSGPSEADLESSPALRAVMQRQAAAAPAEDEPPGKGEPDTPAAAAEVAQDAPAGADEGSRTDEAAAAPPAPAPWTLAGGAS